MTLKLQNIGLASDKRIAHQIRVSDDEGQMSDILLSQSRQPQRAVREVDSLVGPKVLTLRSRFGNFYCDFIKVNRANHTTDLAVVEPYRLSGVYVGKNLW